MMNYAMHLISVLEGTWLHPGTGPTPLKALEAHLDTMLGIVLTFATGRTLASTLDVLANQIRRWPDHLITDVGTAIYHRSPDGRWNEDADYASWVQQRWNDKLPQTAHHWLPEGMRLHREQPSPRRLTLEIHCDRSVKELTDALRQNLHGMGADVDVMVRNRRINLLPMGVNQGSAATFLHRSRRLHGPMVACGTSENDLELFSAADASVLMPDSPLCTSSKRRKVRRAFIPEKTGPAGILQAIQSSTLTYL